MSPRSARAGAAARAVPLFAALGDETRLHLVARLAREGPRSISALAEDAPVSRQAITKHLRALEDAGLAVSRRAGRERVFELRARRLEEVQRYLQRISHQWDAALDRLRAMVED